MVFLRFCNILVLFCIFHAKIALFLTSIDIYFCCKHSAAVIFQPRSYIWLRASRIADTQLTAGGTVVARSIVTECRSDDVTRSQSKCHPLYRPTDYHRVRIDPGFDGGKWLWVGVINMRPTNSCFHGQICKKLFWNEAREKHIKYMHVPKFLGMNPPLLLELPRRIGIVKYLPCIYLTHFLSAYACPVKLHTCWCEYIGYCL